MTSQRRTRRIAVTVSILAAIVLALAGCSGGGEPAAAPDPETPSAAAVDLTVMDSSLGAIVVTGDGMTAYMFTKDEQGS